MASKIKPCTDGKRHSWEHVKNVRSAAISMTPCSGTNVRISAKGLYRCKVCKASKYGQYLPSSEEV